MSLEVIINPLLMHYGQILEHEFSLSFKSASSFIYSRLTPGEKPGEKEYFYLSIYVRPQWCPFEDKGKLGFSSKINSEKLLLI